MLPFLLVRIFLVKLVLFGTGRCFQINWGDYEDGLGCKGHTDNFVCGSVSVSSKFTFPISLNLLTETRSTFDAALSYTIASTDQSRFNLEFTDENGANFLNYSKRDVTNAISTPGDVNSTIFIPKEKLFHLTIESRNTLWSCPIVYILYLEHWSCSSLNLTNSWQSDREQPNSRGIIEGSSVFSKDEWIMPFIPSFFNILRSSLDFEFRYSVTSDSPDHLFSVFVLNESQTTSVTGFPEYNRDFSNVHTNSAKLSVRGTLPSIARVVIYSHSNFPTRLNYRISLLPIFNHKSTTFKQEDVDFLKKLYRMELPGSSKRFKGVGFLLPHDWISWEIDLNETHGELMYDVKSHSLAPLTPDRQPLSVYLLDQDEFVSFFQNTEFLYSSAHSILSTPWAHLLPLALPSGRNKFHIVIMNQGEKNLGFTYHINLSTLNSRSPAPTAPTAPSIPPLSIPPPISSLPPSIPSGTPLVDDNMPKILIGIGCSFLILIIIVIGGGIVYILYFRKRNSIETDYSLVSPSHNNNTLLDARADSVSNSDNELSSS